jgi:chemotaxis protein CheD
MENVILNIGEVKSTTAPAMFVCYGLGSCIGLFVQDRANGIAGGAHILLPDNTKSPAWDGSFYNAEMAIQELFRQLRLKGSSLKNLEAKIVGGAQLTQNCFSVGKDNVNSVLTKLKSSSVSIAGLDVGGKVSRTARYNSAKGELLVRSLEDNHCKVF